MRRSKCSHDWASSCCCFRSGWSPPSGRCFLFGSLALGVYLSPRLFALASRLQSGGVLLVIGLAFCFVLAWLADWIGLAPLIFANMGLTLSVAGVRVVAPHVFSALVVMVIATTVLTPPALKWSFGRET